MDYLLSYVGISRSNLIDLIIYKFNIRDMMIDLLSKKTDTLGINIGYLTPYLGEITKYLNNIISFNFIWINQVDVTNTSLFEFVNTYKAAR